MSADDPIDRLDVITFGCRLNAYESDQALARARADGLENAVIVNTCAVTSEAVRQARQAIRRTRRNRPDAKVIVTGCAAQIDPDAFARMAEVDVVLGNGLKSAPGAYRPDALTQRVRVNDVQGLTETAGHLTAGETGRSRAYVEVQNGCDHRCTFCIIPFGRGASRSTPAGEVVRTIEQLAASGAGEVVLTGVDLTAWGHDLPGQPTLGQLVSRILKLVPQLKCLRLSSIDAAEIDRDLLRCLAEEPRLAPYLHLSLQSGDDLILKRMKRRHSRAQALELVAEVRRARPDTAFGADFIAGFPTETEEMFENTLTLIEEAKLSYVHAFPFSPRPGTPAARMPQLDGRVISERAERLRNAGRVALSRHLDSKIGQRLSALVERDGLARSGDFTEITFQGSAEVGTYADFQVTGYSGNTAIASLVQGRAGLAAEPRSGTGLAGDGSDSFCKR